MKIVKVLKIVFVNILVIAFLLILGELLLRLNEYIICTRFIPPNERKKINHITAFITMVDSKYNKDQYYYKWEFRPFPKNNNKKPSILFFGCSYAYGMGLQDDETFSAQLQAYTGFPVYNLGLSGGGLRETLYILSDKEIYRNLEKNNFDKNNVSYVIYLYMDDHQRRIYSKLRPLVPDYKIVNNNLVYVPLKYKFLKKILLYKTIQEQYFDRYITTMKRSESFDRTALYINKINDEIHKNFKKGNKDTQFVVIVYNSLGNEDWTKLRKNIRVIRISKRSQINIYKVPYVLSESDAHPSALSWKLIVPKLAKMLDLK